MRLLVRPDDARFRGSAHALRSAYNQFTLVEPFPNGNLYFKRVVDRPVSVYVVADKLFILSTVISAHFLVPIGGGRFHLQREGRFFSPGDYLDDDTCSPTGEWTEGKAWEAFRLVDAPSLDQRERAVIARIDEMLGRPADEAPMSDEIEAEMRAYLSSIATTSTKPGARVERPRRECGTEREIGWGFRGSVDVSRRSHAAGWAARHRESTSVSVFVNGVRVGEAACVGERPDVKAAGFALNSAWSFEYPTPLVADDRVAFRFPDGSPLRLAGTHEPYLGSVHALRSRFNGFTLCELPDGRLCFRAQAQGPVCVYVVDNKLFVLGTTVHALRIVEAPDGCLRLRSARDGLLFSLGHPDGDIFVAAADRTVADAWEEFELGPAPALTADDCTSIARIDEIVDRIDDAPALAMLGEKVDAAVIGACVALLTSEEEKCLFAARIADADFARDLVKALPEDPHAQAFLRLLDDAVAPTGDVALGDLWRGGLDGGIPSLPFAINCLARHQRRPTRKACVLATLRNEAPYIVEWLAYHRSIGFERFFIYENDSNDGSRELVDCLHGHGLLDVVHQDVAEGGNAQSSAYTHALSLRPEVLDYEWCAVIDLDEFLLLDEASYATIDDFLIPFTVSDADAIAVNWTVYGPNGRLQRDRERPIMETFTWRHPGPDRHVKSIIRPRKFFSSCAHYPYRYRAQPYVFCDTLGRPHVPLENELAWSTHCDDSRASIAHHLYKSLDEFLLKWSRNRGDNPRRLDLSAENLTKEALEAFVTVFAERDSPGPAGARTIKAAVEARRIRGLPGVAAIERDADERYARSIENIRAMFLDCPAVRASEMGSRFCELIRLAGTRAEI